jgi:hypothetical protein
MLECSLDRPWGVHPAVRNDQPCRRCGWTAPGPKQDALLDAAYEAQERDWLRARAAQLGWVLLENPVDDRLAA